MSDMLVKLYTLPPLAPEIEAQAAQGITIRRGLAPEKHFVADWVERHFSRYWVSECDVGFFGPTGVAESMRGRGVGRALLLACLHAMYDIGYGYAVIGDPGPIEYYAKTVGAQVIEDSSPGFYSGLLARDSE